MSDEEDGFNELALNREHRGHRNNERFTREVQKRWDQGIKIDVGDFEGPLKPEELLDWVDRVD